MRREVEKHLADNIAQLAMRIENDISKCWNKQQVQKIDRDLDIIIDLAYRVKEELNKI